ncbi:hypothetical protein C0992_004367 [Termitomyces sp. T32_za158]|nr:hypothetical protein C0992_004367 [Termitomyces sp. T32_za158]
MPTNKSKTPKNKPKPKPMPKPQTVTPEATIVWSKRTQKALSGKEITPLTVDASGKPTFNANGHPVKITGKRKRGKENSNNTKKPKK